MNNQSNYSDSDFDRTQVTYSSNNNPIPPTSEQYDNQYYQDNYGNTQNNPYQNNQYYENNEYQDQSFYYNQQGYPNYSDNQTQYNNSYANQNYMYSNMPPQPPFPSGMPNGKPSKSKKPLIIGIIIACIIILSTVLILIFVNKDDDNNSSSKKHHTKETISNESTIDESEDPISDDIEDMETEDIDAILDDDFTVDESFDFEDEIDDDELSGIYMYGDDDSLIYLDDSMTFYWFKSMNDAGTFKYGSYTIYVGDDAAYMMTNDYSDYGVTQDEIDTLLDAYPDSELMIIVMENEYLFEDYDISSSDSYTTVLYGVGNDDGYNCVNCNNADSYYFTFYN